MSYLQSSFNSVLRSERWNELSQVCRLHLSPKAKIQETNRLSTELMITINFSGQLADKVKGIFAFFSYTVGVYQSYTPNDLENKITVYTFNHLSLIDADNFRSLIQIQKTLTLFKNIANENQQVEKSNFIENILSSLVDPMDLSEKIQFACQLFDISKDKHLEDLLNSFKFFDLEDPEDFLFQIAKVKIKGRYETKKVLRNLKKFKFEAEVLLRLAHYTKQQYPELLFRYLKEFNFDQDSLYLLAEELAKQNPTILGDHFTEFNLEREEDRFKIFSILLDNKQWIKMLLDHSLSPEKSLSSIFTQFHIQDETYRFELIKKMIETSPFNLKIPLKIFKLNDQELLFKIAMILIAKDPAELIDVFKYLAIQSEQQRAEIAFLLLKKCPSQLIYHFKDFQIQNEDSRFQIVKPLAEEKQNYLIENIDNFQIQDKGKCLELAKIFASTYPSQLMIGLKKLGFEKEDFYLEMAKIAIMNKPESVINHLKTFPFSETARIILAKMTIELDLRLFLNHTDEFNIQNQEDKKEIIAVFNQVNAETIFDKKKANSLNRLLV